MKRALVILVTLLTLAIVIVGTVFAHAKLDKCEPAVGSTVATAPTQIKCVLTEEVETKTATMSVFDASGSQVDKKDAKIDLNDPDRKTLFVSLDASKMKNGVYTVKFHVVTPDDGGVTDGEFQFTVGSGPTPGPTKEALTEVTPTPTTLPTAGGDTGISFALWLVLGAMMMLLGAGVWRFARNK